MINIGPRIQVSQNFYLDEFLDPVTYMRDDRLSIMDPVIIDCTQLLRTIYGKSIAVNNWWKYITEFNHVQDLYDWVENQRGVYQHSGFRADFSRVGGRGSAHRKGKATDPKGDQDEFYEIIEDNAKLFYNTGLRRLENPEITPGWMHMDTYMGNHTPDRIRVVNRKTHEKDIII